MHLKLLLLDFLLILAPTVYAGEPPTLISPNNNASVSSSTLTWQAPSYQIYSSSPYRVQVDDDTNFSSLNKDYYTKNTYYTPVLNPGTWFWRVKAKDASGIWSDWSTVWSFNLTAGSISASPSPTPTSTPSTSPPTSSPTFSPSAFTISNVPAEITSEQPFTMLVNLNLPNSPNTTFYLKGAFKKADSSNYLGLTNVSGNWVKNGASYSSQYQITTDSSGNWSGNIEVKPDSEDSGFSGTGDYIFKVGRYTSSGSGPTWSNETTIKIVTVASEGGTTSTSSNASPPSNASYESKSSPGKVTRQASEKSTPEFDYQIATIAAATASAKEATQEAGVKSQKQTNYMMWVGLVMILSGIAVFSYIYLRRKGLYEAIFDLFRKRD